MDLVSAQTLILDTLYHASSQNPEILKPAEAKLQEWEIQPNFYTILFNIISNHSIDLHVRWMAVLYFKNGVDKYWRKNAPNAISEQEKTSLRKGLVANFHEPVNQIAVQLAVLVSKVARFDCPREWPELIPTLLSAIETSDSVTQHRALLVLHHVIKALSSKKLPGDKKLFQEMTANVYSFILNLWNGYTETFLLQISQNATAEVITESLEKALLTLRVLRKLTVHGLKKPHESEHAVLFLKVVFDRARATLECRKQLRGKGIYLLELCEKFIIHLTKILLAVLEFHPYSFVDLIQPTLEFSVFYLFSPEGAHLLYERFIIQCFNLIKGILLCVEYKPIKMRGIAENPESIRAYEIKIAFFQPNVLTEMCRKLVSHYFLLKQDDLEMWDADPETFATDEGGESWKYSLRPSTERVFVTLFHEFGRVLSPILLEMISATHELVPPNDLAAILQKDAMYSAAGLAAFHLYDEINFDQWFTTTLTQELKVKDNNYRIIRRRVTWLIGIWIGIKLSPELRPALYSMILTLLQPDEDMAVRLTASSTLRNAIDDFEFNCEQFSSYLEPTFSLLFTLLKEAHECDTKMHVLYVLSLIVERVGVAIRPHVESLVAYLPLLWAESEEHNMLRCAIVSTLVQLVKALGSSSVALWSFLLPVIRLGTDLNQNAYVYLLEDSLELWLAVLENSSTMTEDLFYLFDNMPALLDHSTENLRVELNIVQAHFLLAPERSLTTQGPAVVAVCDSLLSDMRSEGTMMMMRLVETCLRGVPSIAVEIIKPMLPRIFGAVYKGEEQPMLMSMYLSVLSRVLLCAPNTFSLAVNQLAQNIGESPETTLCKLLTIWTHKMSEVSQLERRKLLSLALASLLTAQSRAVFECFDSIITNIVETLNDVQRTDERCVTIDSLVVSDDSGPKPDEMCVAIDSLVISENVSPSAFQDDVDYETEHDHRRKQLTTSDPVYTIVLKDYFQAKMHELRNQIGQVQFNEHLSRVDPYVLEQVRDYIMN